jgi:hypothetical protein
MCGINKRYGPYSRTTGTRRPNLPALEQPEAPRIHPRDLCVYVLNEVAEMVHPLAVLAQTLGVSYRLQI